MSGGSTTAARRRRNAELVLVVIAAVITGLAYVVTSLGTNATIPAHLGWFLGLVFVLVFIAHLAVRRLAAG
ncbi:MAG: hypothetical protein CSA55_05060, partial [Ilumatobacter coccineus]